MIGPVLAFVSDPAAQKHLAMKYSVNFKRQTIPAPEASSIHFAPRQRLQQLRRLPAVLETIRGIDPETICCVDDLYLKIGVSFSHRSSDLIHLNHLVDVTLWPGELCRIFDLDQDNEVQVVPHIVFSPDVFFKCHIFVVKLL